MMDFDTANTFFKNDKIGELAKTTDGMRFLKLRSLSRKSQMQYLIDKHNIDVGDITSKGWLRIIYNSNIKIKDVDQVILDLYERERQVRRNNENQLVNELYKIQSFEWGGLHQNSLEKTIVDNYVKKIKSYELLSKAIENDLHNSMRAYVLASWYNHWSSIMIEDIFKDHSQVIPAIGLIKKIDFFINNRPFDLKVTYLPEGYIKNYRRTHQLRPELTLMKAMARELDISFEQSSADSVLIPDLWQKLDDHPDNRASELISELENCRKQLLNDSMVNPQVLVRWLYENQGVRRFDASNRLFLVLIDKSNFFDSWKLKRARPLIAQNVNKYLDEVDQNVGFQLNFQWEEKTYTTESDIIFVVKS
ncbi:hypothetical protein [Crocosphaera sp.]|uniref:hypothetical protein n=1 Tax=Crocosphaera sp. TaxID=2729996 RepID=UPI002626A576|nr:hypothetical protein [Crocosphaera sp.]MDJ0581001.1 hypothetical protein [Crocosphaera sp.]